MIVDAFTRKPKTATKAAKELVYFFGNQLTSMGPDEWDGIVDVEKLTDKDESLIYSAIVKQSGRVRKFLGLSK